jgi:hypothetical protein
MVSFYSCGPRLYSYKFSMKESKKPHKLYYKNDTLTMSFNFYSEGLMVDFTNNSDELIKINWDELRMAVNKTNKKIEHMQINNEGEIILLQPPSIISPKSECTDLVVYADNVYYLKEFGKEIKMKIKDTYPREGNKSTRDYIQKLKGQRITLLFPVEINNVSYSWVFNFLLEDIKNRSETAAVILSVISSLSFPSSF